MRHRPLQLTRSAPAHWLYLVLLPVLGGFQSYSLAAELAKMQVGRQRGDGLGRTGIIAHGVVVLQPVWCQEALLACQRLRHHTTWPGQLSDLVAMVTAACHCYPMV